MRKLPIVPSGLVVLMALAGCSGTGTPGGTETTQPAATAQMTAQTPPTIENSPTATSDNAASPTEEASPGSTSTEDQESPSPSGGTTEGSLATDDSVGAEPTPGGALPPDVKGQTLVLADFFNPDSGWTEGRYDVADQGSVSGIAREVSTCGPGDSVPTLELRLANNFDDLKFEVGQDNESRSSDQTLTLRVEGNNKQLDVQTIPFNEVQDFSVPVADVNALKIQFYLDDQNENCYQGSVQAVIYDVELQ